MAESETERRQRMAKLLTDPKTKRGRLIRAYFEVLEASGEPVPPLHPSPKVKAKR